VTCADRRVHELSPGELRRVAIARALVAEPAVLLAEEPMAGLGTAERFHLMRILRAASGMHRLTMVVATAEEDVARWADRRVALPKAVVAEASAAHVDSAASAGSTVTSASGASQHADGRTLQGMRHRFAHAGRHRAAGGLAAGACTDALVGERSEAGAR
jgi:ABC-type phosphate/phosphonate transport system ATPase subunit